MSVPEIGSEPYWWKENFISFCNFRNN